VPRVGIVARLGIVPRVGIVVATRYGRSVVNLLGPDGSTVLGVPFVGFIGGAARVGMAAVVLAVHTPLQYAMRPLVGTESSTSDERSPSICTSREVGHPACAPPP
jgi:hypothetical protein